MHLFHASNKKKRIHRDPGRVEGVDPSINTTIPPEIGVYGYQMIALYRLVEGRAQTDSDELVRMRTIISQFLDGQVEVFGGEVTAEKWFEECVQIVNEGKKNDGR
jgi:hypothetical protein